MRISNDYTVIIPHDWSDEEALTVVGFLEQLAQCIWNLHGDGMMAAMRRRNAAASTVQYRPPHEDDDLPWEPRITPKQE